MPSTCCASTSSAPVEQRRRVLGAEIVGVERRPALQHLEAVGGNEDRLATARPCGGWRGRCAAPAGWRPSARRHGRRDRRRPSRCRDRASRWRRRRAGCSPPSPSRPCGAGRHRASRDAARSAAMSSLIRQSSWNSSSAWLRVLTKSSVVRCSLHRVVDLGNGIARRCGLPRARAPRNRGSRCRGLAPPATVIRSARRAGRVLRHQPAPQLVRLGDGRRQADRLQAGDEAAQPRQPERQQMAALRGHQRMQLVEHDVAQVREEALGIRGRDQQRQLLRRGQQDVRRRQLLALALVGGRVAGARLQARSADPSRRPACRGCARCRRRAPSAARCRACGCRDAPRPACASAASARSVSVGRKPASVLPAPVGAISSTDCPACARASSSIWCGARRPAALREPFQERLRQQGGRVLRI